MVVLVEDQALYEEDPNLTSSLDELRAYMAVNRERKRRWLPDKTID